MIRVRDLNYEEFLLNEIQIEKIEEVRETVITMMNGKKYLVSETVDEILEKIIEFKKEIYR